MSKRYDLDFTIVCIGMPMSGQTIPSGESLGGSETASIQVSEALVRAGNRVTLICNTATPHEANGVTYMPMGWVPGPGGQGQFPKGAFDFLRTAPCDVIVGQRQPVLFQFDYPSKCNFLWQHDLATRTGPSNFGATVWNLDKVLVLSEFMKQQYKQVHGGVDSLYHVTRNGVDLELIDSVPEQERDRFKLMFTARPERGLDILLTQVWPEVLRREPRATLYVSRYGDVATLPLYNEMTELAKRYGDSVRNLGNLGKRDLYAHYKQARLFLYSSVFEEVSHITSMELAACGTPMIGPWKGACPETCAGTHVLIRDDGTIGKAGDPIDPGFKTPTPEFIKTFVDQTVDLMHDDRRWNALSKAARARSERWQWDEVAEEWTDLAHNIIAQRSGNDRRLVKHFLALSDVTAARRLAERTDDRAIKNVVQKYTDRYVPFMNIVDEAERKGAIARFYEARSGGDAADFRTAMWADTEPRLGVLVDWIRRHEDEIGSVLDFGCAHGGYVRTISNSFAALELCGADVAPSLIRCANELKAATLPDGNRAFLYPDRCVFQVADEDTPILDEDGNDRQFDLVVAMELVEHLPDVKAVVAKLERHCKPGGWMCLTVPVGYNERSDLVCKGVPPTHLHSFDQHDVLDLFGHRKDFQVLTFSNQKELELDRTFAGNYMVFYRADGQAVGEIDWDRKLFLQGPRETLAVCMIVHNCEDTLHRTLRSVQRVADQIVVVDNGPSSDRTVQVAQEYTDDVRAGTSPFWCRTHLTQHTPEGIQPGLCDMAGFETPRNESIEDVWCDWIAWIDSDEALLDWNALWKYLRPNHLLGYAVPQHHIAVDPPGVLKKDIPVRLFRNHANIRYYGRVHEHAETGINQGVGAGCMLIGDVHLHHDGYLTESIRRKRFWRNLRLLECDRLAYPDRLLGKFLYDMRDNMHLAKYAMEANGHRVTPDVRAHLTQVTKAYRDNFLSTDYVFLADDATNYYSEAMALLGEGMEVCTSLDVKPMGAALNGTVKFRAADQKEAKVILDKLLAAKWQPWEGPYSR